jgi:hypothetical protein
MKKILLLFTLLLTISCSSLGDAQKVLKNEKIRTTDEFLVKKKAPLELPPDFQKMPTPDSLKKNDIKSKSEKDKIKDILNKGKTEKVKDNKINSTEKAILNRIRK